MKKRLIYLQFGFWEKIKKRDSVLDKRIFWDLYGALECATIIADIPEEMWEKDELLYYLQQGKYDGNGGTIIETEPHKIEEALDSGKKQPVDNLCAVYLLDKDNIICDGLSKQQGILCLNVEMLVQNNKYVRGCAAMYSKGDVFDGFSKCKQQFNIPCNSLLIIDPYIAKKKESIEKNLIPILDAILPASLHNSKFHITIMCETDNCFVKKYEEPLKNEKIKEYIENQIRTIREKLDISFTLCSIKTTGNGDGDFHSRHILTNNMLINSEDGFDLFGWNRNEKKVVCGKHARIEFLIPSLMDNRRMDAENYYRWMHLASKNSKSEDSWGTNENRLFELVD